MARIAGMPTARALERLEPRAVHRRDDAARLGLGEAGVNVSFVKSGARRYGVRVERDRAPALCIESAPGYDDHLPHDLLHFVAEAEFGLDGAVFGDLARRQRAPSSSPWNRTLVAKMWRKERKHVRALRTAAATEELAAALYAAWRTRRDDRRASRGLPRLDSSSTLARTPSWANLAHARCALPSGRIAHAEPPRRRAGADPSPVRQRGAPAARSAAPNKQVAAPVSELGRRDPRGRGSRCRRLRRSPPRTQPRCTRRRRRRARSRAAARAARASPPQGARRTSGSRAGRRRPRPRPARGRGAASCERSCAPSSRRATTSGRSTPPLRQRPRRGASSGRRRRAGGAVRLDVRLALAPVEDVVGREVDERRLRARRRAACRRRSRPRLLRVRLGAVDVRPGGRVQHEIRLEERRRRVTSHSSRVSPRASGNSSSSAAPSWPPAPVTTTRRVPRGSAMTCSRDGGRVRRPTGRRARRIHAVVLLGDEVREQESVSAS